MTDGDGDCNCAAVELALQQYSADNSNLQAQHRDQFKRVCALISHY